MTQHRTPRAPGQHAHVVPFSGRGRDDRALLGGKGANLAELTGLGVPVPPGFVITTTACVEYQETGELPHGLLAAARDLLVDTGHAVGRTFAADERPLLVSVRSGAPVSMPGMMDTILNIGLSTTSIEGLAADMVSHELAADCFARLVHSFAATVHGAVLPQAEAASPADLIATYADVTGRTFPDDPPTQLAQAIVAVFDSWNSPRARRYRRFHRLPDTGTAAVVQAMVFGNAGEDSGTGVLFTRDPSTGENALFGDYLPGAQGEDIVAGTHDALDLAAMRDAAPAAYDALRTHARTIEAHFGDMSEIEFTVERGSLWILQTRSGQRSVQAAVRIAVEMAEEGDIDRATALRRIDADKLDAHLRPHLDRARVSGRDIIAQGIGATPGVVTGRLAFDSERAAALSEAGEAVVLARPETRPEDLEGILAADGLLTSRGGKTSHAAVVARGLGRCCVCGVETVVIDMEQRTLRAGDVVMAEGELVSLDGEGGWVIRGTAPLRETTPAPELETLLRWSHEAASLAVDGIVFSREEGDLAIAQGADGLLLQLSALAPGGPERIEAARRSGREWAVRVTDFEVWAPGAAAWLSALGEPESARDLIVPAGSVEPVREALGEQSRWIVRCDRDALSTWEDGEAPAERDAQPRWAAPPSLTPDQAAHVANTGAERLAVTPSRIVAGRVLAAQASA